MILQHNDSPTSQISHHNKDINIAMSPTSLSPLRRPDSELTFRIVLFVATKFVTNVGENMLVLSSTNRRQNFEKVVNMMASPKSLVFTLIIPKHICGAMCCRKISRSLLNTVFRILSFVSACIEHVISWSLFLIYLYFGY